MSVVVKKLLLDALKSRELSIIELAKALGLVEGVNDVNIVVVEVDSNTETLKLTIDGSQINYGQIQEVIQHYGVSLKGVDEVSVTKA
jgi:hypothetical protein